MSIVCGSEDTTVGAALRGCPFARPKHHVLAIRVATEAHPYNRLKMYPFADIDLARRLERTEVHGSVQFVEARKRAFPDRGATWIEVAGTHAMFDGVGSPVTQTFGLGMFEPITAEQLTELEEFFRSRGAEIFHEVCPLADSSVFELIRARDYKPVEFSNVLYRPIDPDLRLPASRNEEIKVRVVEKNDVDLWAATACEGWSEFPEVTDFLKELNQVRAHSTGLSFLAELNGQPIAAGALTIAGGIA